MSDELYSAKVPEPMKGLFLKAQEKMEKLMQKIKYSPDKGRIEIDSDRYLMIRAGSLADGFIEEAEKMVGRDTAEMLLYNFAYSIGKREAKDFIKKFDLKDPIEKLSAGPIYFSFVGLALVDIFKESNPTPDENFLLVYEHPHSFEAEVYQKEGKKTDHPICFFSAGYSAGWCSEAFGLELQAKEISCVAAGDSSCRFIMFPYDRAMEYLEKVDEYKNLSH